MTIYGADVVTCARSWIEPRTKWQHGACLKGVATDCIGLIGGVAAELGISDAWTKGGAAEFKGYGRQPDPKRLLAACNRFLERVTGPRQLGDVLILSFVEEPQHFAFLSALDPPYMIHAYTQARRVTENRIDELWASRILATYRLPGVLP